MVLGIAQVGIHDNFFELGGHSLLAMQVATRVGEAFEVEIPLRDTFEFPTVAELAARVEERIFDATDERTLASALAECEALEDDDVRKLLTSERSPETPEERQPDQE